MHIVNKLKKLWPFNIKFYALSFIIMMSLVFGVLGWAMQYKLDTIRSEGIRHSSQLALEEMHYVFSHTLDEIKIGATSIAKRADTQQQFLDHSAYSTWYDKRILTGSLLPIFADTLELYSKHGKSLSTTTSGNMPKKISGSHPDNFIMRRDGRDFLYLFYPIPPNQKSTAPLLGHLGLQVSILDVLKNEQRFNHVKIDTLKLNIAEGEKISVEQLFSRMAFELIPNAENKALTSSIERFQRQILFVMIVLYFVFYLLLSTVLSAPLRRLSNHIDSLRNGQNGLLAPSYAKILPLAELEKIRTSLNDYQNKLDKMHLNLNEKNDELWQLAHHDSLTGVYNRRGFEEDWKHMLSVSSGHRLGVALILFDCDHFKAINDTYGHPTGDQVIQAITRTLQNTLRHGDRLYRIGGDEFATLFLDIDTELALLTAERCIEAVSQYDFVSLGIKEPVRVSAGMAYAVGTDVETLANLPKQADVAMYHAKRPGKKKIAVFEQSMIDNASILFSNSINSLVFTVLENDDSVEMHYQPLVNLSTGKIDYYEALVRIRDGDNLIMPSTIFPLIEERRLEAEFDLVVLTCIAKDIDAGKIPAGRGVTLNISGPGVLHPLVQEKLNSFAKYLDRYKLIIEITETALITQLHLASSVLNKFRQMGFKIALDDFGSGYSSLSYLSNMPVDCVKFDVSLIRQLFEGSKQSLIIENLAAMVIKAGYDLVAEGIETEEVLKKVAHIGFSRGQGYLFGRPESTCHESAQLSFFEQ